MPNKEDIMKKIIEINGMSCQHCVGTLTAALKAIAGVDEVQIDLSKRCATLTINADITDAAFIEAVENCGFDVMSIQ